MTVFSIMIKSLRWLLLPLGIVHWCILQIRHFCYDRRIFAVKKLPVPVISIGNIQMGGTGKTPFVQMCIDLLQDQYRLGILSRGYGRKSREHLIISANTAQKDLPDIDEIGDEPGMLLSRLKTGEIGIGAERYQVGRKLLAAQPVELILLDDGFQHRHLERDLDICLIDVSRWHFHPFLFPFSQLRDVKSALGRAGIIVLTKGENYPERKSQLTDWISEKYQQTVFIGRFETEQFERLDGSIISLDTIKEGKVGAFCGIANPLNFFDGIEREEITLSYRGHFSDHQEYNRTVLEKISQETAKLSTVVVTEKDAVKLLNNPWLPEALAAKIVVMKIHLKVTNEKLFLKKMQLILEKI